MSRTVQGIEPGSDGTIDDTNSAGGGPNQGGDGTPWGALAIGGGAILNWLGGQSNNDANSAEAAKNRKFAHDEADLSRRWNLGQIDWLRKTGYQATMEDMKNAGINPILAAKMGPEMGTGGAAQASAPGNAVMQNAIGQGVNSAMAGASLINDLRNTNADITYKQASALLAANQAAQSASSARNIDEQTADIVSSHDAKKASAVRDAGDARWEDANRTARMITGKAGIASAIVNSAKAGDDLLDGLVGHGSGMPNKIQSGDPMKRQDLINQGWVPPAKSQRPSDYLGGMLKR